MTWLKACWYAAAWADDVPADGRLVRNIIEEPILFWRDADGQMRAMADRCAHRLAPLSLGNISGNVVRCRYHGLAFDGDTGRCVHNPHGPALRALAVRTYPVIERHSLIWIWMGTPQTADTEAIPDLSFIDDCPAHAFSRGYIPTAADHHLLEDNILDLSHGDYLHPETLGGGAFTRAMLAVKEQADTLLVRWEAKNEKAIPIWQPEMPDPDRMTDMTTEVLWHPSGVMTLYGDAMPVGYPPERGVRTWNVHIMTPQSRYSTHYLYCNARDYRTEDAHYNAAISAGLAKAFAEEDKPMIEAQQSRIGHNDLFDCQPTLLTIDNASIRARRIYRRLVEAEQAATT